MVQAVGWRLARSQCPQTELGGLVRWNGEGSGFLTVLLHLLFVWRRWQGVWIAGGGLQSNSFESGRRGKMLSVGKLVRWICMSVSRKGTSRGLARGPVWGADSRAWLDPGATGRSWTTKPSNRGSTHYRRWRAVVAFGGC